MWPLVIIIILQVMTRALWHSDACYNIPNIRVSGHLCKTNIPSNTGFRGFGGPQGMFVAETWIEQIASTLGIPVEKVSDFNLISKQCHVLPHCLE
jgi:xanthine dehydrogenase/oxidase